MCQCRRRKRRRFYPCVGEISWRRAWLPTPLFLHGESPWTEKPGGLQSLGPERVGHDRATKHSNLTVFSLTALYNLSCIVGFQMDKGHNLMCQSVKELSLKTKTFAIFSQNQKKLLTPLYSWQVIWLPTSRVSKLLGTMLTLLPLA